MSRFEEKTIHCPACGAAQQVQVPTSINASMRNSFKADILSGEFQRITCGACAHSFRTEAPFMYMDFDAKLWIAHFPAEWERGWTELENEPREQFEKYMSGTYASPHARAMAEGFTLRTVFGLEQLAEKLMLKDAGINDHLIVVLQWQLMNVAGASLHPDLRPRLSAVNDQELFFTQRNRETLVLDRAQAIEEVEQQRELWAAILNPLTQACYVDCGRFLMGGD